MPSRDFDPKEGGYTQIMNEFIDNLTNYRLDSNEWSLVMLIIRNSWGIKGQAWAQKLTWDKMKEKTGLGNGPLGYARAKLIARNFVHTRKNGRRTHYKINSKYETWIPEDQLPTYRKAPKLHSSEVKTKLHSSEVSNSTPVEFELHSSGVVPYKERIKKTVKETPIIPNGNGEGGSTVLTKKQIVEQDAKAVVDYMNELSGKTFKHSDTSLSKIRGRLREGYTLEQCLTVCLNKWLDPDHKEKYYRPITLFRPSLFESYVNEKGANPKMSKKKAKMFSTMEAFARRYHDRQQEAPGSD
jgi:uncharacterized phage protein (TIGR02220 family)